MSTPTRTTVVWVPDWTVVAAMSAAGVPAHQPAVVHDGHRVLATSALARAEGVRRGMRRRQAQGCCPELALLAADEARDVTAFEPVAAAAEQVVAGVEVARAGLLLLPAGGASRYHGSEELLAIALVEAVAERTGFECAVGTADGLLAAVLAARTGAVVEPGASAHFLAPYPVGELVHVATDPDQARAVGDLVDLLHRLGLRTLGAFAALPGADVHARFGRTGSWASTMARGLDTRPPARRRPEADLEVGTSLDPPADRVDIATFAGRRLAEQLHELLVERRATCGRLRISARTEDGADLVRVWRTDPGGWGALTPVRITERVRWQLEGWLTTGRLGGGPGGAPMAVTDEAAEESRPVTLVRLGLTALDVAPAGAQQSGLWGAPSGSDLRAVRALERVQTIVGVDGVLTATVQGGRDAREQVHLQPWGQVAAPPRRADLPWPGRLPAPAPSTVLDAPLPVGLRDALGGPVRLDHNGQLTAAPARLHLPAPRPAEPTGPRSAPARTAAPGRPEPARRVVGWAGPWVSMPRWWQAPTGPDQAPGLRAHLQVVLDDDRALLLVGGPDGWSWDAEYD
jgi:protein ImuB